MAPGRVAVAGDSAGGNLAAVVALMARDRGGPGLAFRLLIYPVTVAHGDFPSMRENAESHLLQKASMDWFWAHYLAEDSDADNPLRAPDLSGLPPALIDTREFDPLRDEGEAYGQRLRDSGVQARISRYDTWSTGFS